MLSKVDNNIAINKIRSISANIAGQLNLAEVDIKIWLIKLFHILEEFYCKYHNRQFVLAISDKKLTDDDLKILSADLLWEFISKGIECFQIDLDLNFSYTSDIKSSEITDISKYCCQNKLPVLRFFGEDCHLYDIEGHPVVFYNFIHPEVEKQRRTGIDARSYRDYKLVIDEQGEKQLTNKIDEIWHDRDNRILIARKTEKMLQNFLAKWLHENLHDARVVSEVGKISGIDRTDIEITGISTGDQIIIEVKWMGKNYSGTSYDIGRFEEGIRQVCSYLNREPSALEGCLVCYDGRKNNDYIPIEKQNARLECRIIWLESRSGSEIGAQG